MSTITYGSVCSGIEAATVAWHSMGWQAAWLAEIEPAPSAVLAHHYPNVPNLGDMTKIAAMVRAGTVAAPDVLVGGTPCQAFSIAGLRNSLDDARGQLSLSFVDLANAIDAARIIRGEPAATVLWENVPGVLSTSDNAFGCFLGALAGEDEPVVPPGKKWTNAGCVFGPQRTVSWRVLDAQYFGVAQRRRRVFVVASARDGFDPAKVLFEFEGVRWDIAPRREAGKSVTNDIAPCLTSSGRGVERAGDTRGQDAVVGCRMVAFGEYAVDGTASTMKMRDYKDATDLVAYSVALRGRDGGATAELGDDVAGCLRASGGGGDKAHVLAFSCKDNGRDATDDLSPTLRSMGHSGSHQNGGGQVAVCITPFDTTQITSVANGSNPKPGDPCHPLAAGAHAPAVCITGDITHTLKGEGFDGSEDGTGRGNPIVTVPIGLDEEQNAMIDAFGTLKARAKGGGFEGTVMQSNMVVRRLTPKECARLQGFPDIYLSSVIRNGKPLADGPMYKAFGNSMCVNVMAWIGQRIQMVNNTAKEHEIVMEA